MKKWIVKVGNAYHKIGSSIKPKEYAEIAEAPIDPLTGKHEDPAWLQIEMIADEHGQMIPTATVNQLLKDEIQAAQIVTKAADDEKKVIKQASKDSLFDYLANFDETKIKNIADIQVFAGKMKEYMLYKYENELKEHKNKG